MFTLILPHFLRHADENMPPLHTPALNQLLRFGRFQAVPRSRTQLYQQFLCNSWDLSPQQCYVSPIHQQMGINSVQVLHSSALSISADESRQLCDGLNHLYGDDAQFDYLRPDLWRLTLPSVIAWQAVAIFDLHHTLQTENTAAQWLSLSTEIQMWLHDHPLNRQRKLPINGAWLWRLPENTSETDCPKIIASDSLWVSHSNLNVCGFPEHFATWLNQHGEFASVFSEQFCASAQTGDVWAYHDILTQWDTDIFAPLLSALRSGSLKHLRMVCEQGEWHITHQSHYAFWKRKRIFDGKSF